MQKVLVIGLDCIGAEVLSESSLAELPNLARLAHGGLKGPLLSTQPPITVPAWTSMVSGRDPGELGIYGFRNRRRYDYEELAYATSRQVRWPRLWDHVGAAGGRSIVVGMPQTAPAPEIDGDLVAGFEAEGFAGCHTHPPELSDEIARVVGDYQFDVTRFRNRPRSEVLDEVVEMTEKRFRLMEHFMRTRDWDFAMICEIGPDRMHHCFWSDHDPNHPRHIPLSPFRDAIRSYYRLVDELLGRLVTAAGPDCTVVIASDHGAKPMHGGVCINEVLRRHGWLVLRDEPEEPMPLSADMVAWSRTRAWAAGGYYARVFLNIDGREPQGVLPADGRDEAREALTQLLSTLELKDGPTLENDVVWPERAYRRVRGLAPDLLVFFSDLEWRSLGSVGHGRTWLVSNDTGTDEANHAYEGVYVLCGPGIPRGTAPASILDITPTLLAHLGLAVPPDLTGVDLVQPQAVATG